MDWGIKSSKENEDVRLSRGNKLNFSSTQNTFKVKLSGTGTVGSSATATIAHGLGYKPQFMAWIEEPGSTDTVLISATLAGLNKAQAYADETNLYIKNGHASSRDYIYYIMYDPIIQ